MDRSKTLCEMNHFRPLAGVPLLVLLGAGLAACSPEYENGITACGAAEPRCPDGFTCVGIRCYKKGQEPTNVERDAGSTTGAGGSLGTGGGGGASTAGGSGGGAPMGGTGATGPATGGSGAAGSGGGGTGAGGTGAAAMCMVAPNATPCAVCLGRKCCAEALACNRDPMCAMKMGAAYQALVTCAVPACPECGMSSGTGGAGGTDAGGSPGTGGSGPAPGAGSAVKFCHVVDGITGPIEMTIGSVKLTAPYGQCSGPMGQPCTPMPAGRATVTTSTGGRPGPIMTFETDLMAGKEYVFVALVENGKIIMKYGSPTAPKTCANYPQ
jgi:hypothetical protein